jgi:hypothetical protein
MFFTVSGWNSVIFRHMTDPPQSAEIRHSLQRTFPACGEFVASFSLVNRR